MSNIPESWHYVSDDEIRIGQYVAIPPYENSGDIGTVEHWDDGWYVRLIGTAELTGPWATHDLVNQARDTSNDVDRLTKHASAEAIEAAMSAGEQWRDMYLAS